MATMRDVAALAGVSAKTVSRVLNQDPHVRSSTREVVETAMRQLDYVPNTLATTFRSGRSPVIGVAVPDIVDPFFAAIVRAVERIALARDMSTLVTTLGDDPTRERSVLESLLRRQLGGLIVAPIGTDYSYLKPWGSRTPLVFVDRSPGRLPFDSFVEDDYRGAFDGANHLLHHGHRRVAFLGDSPTLTTTSARFAGYAAALSEAGIPADEALYAFGADSRGGAEEALERLLGLPEPPTAVFSSNARCTISVLPCLPRTRLALVGFGDFPLADLVCPPITVVAQDPEQLGTLAAGRVFDRLGHPHRRFRRRTVLPVHLIERLSCVGSAEPETLESEPAATSPSDFRTSSTTAFERKAAG
ncbi:LacI family DNA-binding transcriptional regulator [Georgenia sp. SUBG003]|uniref:LacI family DNA-binding transcriptional regulator n=1 Tax=Georgenia sp. SUBG003 TaxID=1497974 RepID=UPI000694CEF5